MRRRAPAALLPLLFVAWVAAQDASTEFADALEQCIVNHAQVALDTLPTWADSCMPPTQKIDVQAKVYETTLNPMRDQYGYTGALWCAFYSLRMTGLEYDPNSTQPNNPNVKDWYETLLCPWDFDSGCAEEPLGLHGDEWTGVPAGWGSNQNAQYQVTPDDPYVQDEPDRRTMSCGLCGHLKRRFGAAPYFLDRSQAVINDPGREHLYTANWDFHPFGAWLANEAALRGHQVEGVVEAINNWKASNGEEMHGYLWQSLRLLAYDTGTLDGQRKATLDDVTPVQHMLKVCAPTWWLAPQTRDDCAHAAGHGLFYYYMDIGRAVMSCWTDEIVDHTPCGSFPPKIYLKEGQECTRKWPKNGRRELAVAGAADAGDGDGDGDGSADGDLDSYSYDFSNPCLMYGLPKGTIECPEGEDQDTDSNLRSSGLNPKDMLKWRWLCATGVYHAAGNTLSSEIYRDLAASGSGAEEYLCRRSNLWGDEQRWFDRCAAGLGMIETEARLDRIKDGTCHARTEPNGAPTPPAPWESHWLRQYGQTLHRSCNPAKYFVIANDKCPLAYRAHYPCKPTDKDYKMCSGHYHWMCSSHDALREIFQCDQAIDPGPRTTDKNWVNYAFGWKMGDPLGVWGGRCQCPDGRVYTAGDEGNMCDSIACHGGKQLDCVKEQNPAAFREVFCAPPVSHAPQSQNQVFENWIGAGTFGGTCTCPDGEVYLVGDEKNACGSLSCVNGEPGLCNHYESSWKHRRVVCAQVAAAPPHGPIPPPPKPTPPPSPDPPPGSPQPVMGTPLSPSAVPVAPPPPSASPAVSRPPPPPLPPPPSPSPNTPRAGQQQLDLQRDNQEQVQEQARLAQSAAAAATLPSEVDLAQRGHYFKMGLISLGGLVLLITMIGTILQRRAAAAADQHQPGGPVAAKKRRTKGPKPRRLRSVEDEDDEILGDESAEIQPA